MNQYPLTGSMRPLRGAKNTQKIDHFSRLPSELLDHIFSLASTSARLSIVPPSKRLLRAHRQALYRSITITSLTQVVSLAKTLKAAPQKYKIKSLSWSAGGLVHGSDQAVQELLPRLSGLVELAFDQEGTMFCDSFGLSPQPKPLFTNLQTIRFASSFVSWEIVGCLSQFPKLRRVELAGFWIDGELPDTTPTADQVTEVHIVGSYGHDTAAEYDMTSTTFLRFFPSAKIVCLDLTSVDQGGDFSVKKISSYYAKSALTLRLQARSLENRYVGSPNRNSLDYFSSFVLLEKLHLDLSSTIEPLELSKNLSSLSSLVSLSLILNELDPEFLNLFKLVSPHRLRQLHSLSIEYSPIKQGRIFDFDYATRELAGNRYEHEGRGLVLLEGDPLEIWKLRDWGLPFGKRIGEGILLAKQVKEIAEQAGINVQTNLNRVQKTLHLQLIESFSRGIGHVGLYGDTRFVKAAIELGRKHGSALPSLKIDLDREVKKKELELFKTDMSLIVRCGKRCEAWNLKYK